MKNSRRWVLFVMVAVVFVSVFILVLLNNPNFSVRDQINRTMLLSGEKHDMELNSGTVLTRDYAESWDDLLDSVSGEVNLNLYTDDNGKFTCLPVPDIDWKSVIDDFDINDLVVENPDTIALASDQYVISTLCEDWVYRAQEANLTDNTVTTVSEYSNVYFTMDLYLDGELIEENSDDANLDDVVTYSSDGDPITRADLLNLEASVENENVDVSEEDLSESNVEDEESVEYSIFDMGSCSFSKRRGFDFLYFIDSVFYENFSGKSVGDNFSFDVTIPDDLSDFGLSGVDEYIGKTLTFDVVIGYVEEYPAITDENVSLLFDEYDNVDAIIKDIRIGYILFTSYPDYRNKLYQAISDKFLELYPVKYRPIEWLDFYISAILSSYQLNADTMGVDVVEYIRERWGSVQDLILSFKSSYDEGNFDKSLLMFVLGSNPDFEISTDEFNRVKDVIACGIYGDSECSYDVLVSDIGSSFAEYTVKDIYVDNSICSRATIVDSDGNVVDNMFVADYDMDEDSVVFEKLVSLVD